MKILANGIIVSRTEFPKLFELIGTNFNLSCEGDSFAVPDMRSTMVETGEKVFPYEIYIDSDDGSFGDYRDGLDKYHVSPWLTIYDLPEMKGRSEGDRSNAAAR